MSSAQLRRNRMSNSGRCSSEVRESCTMHRQRMSIATQADFNGHVFCALLPHCEHRSLALAAAMQPPKARRVLLVARTNSAAIAPTDECRRKGNSGGSAKYFSLCCCCCRLTSTAASDADAAHTCACKGTAASLPPHCLSALTDVTRHLASLMMQEQKHAALRSRWLLRLKRRWSIHVKRLMHQSPLGDALPAATLYHFASTESRRLRAALAHRASVRSSASLHRLLTLELTVALM